MDCMFRCDRDTLRLERWLLGLLQMWLQSPGSSSGQPSMLLLPPCGSGCMRGLGRLASQTSLPHLPFTSDSAMSDSSARLCLAWGRSRGLRPALRAPLRERASSDLMPASLSTSRHRPLSPNDPQAVSRGPLERVLSIAACPPLSGSGARASPPHWLPHQAGRLDLGLRPPMARLPPTTPLRCGIGRRARAIGPPVECSGPARLSSGAKKPGPKSGQEWRKSLTIKTNQPKSAPQFRERRRSGGRMPPVYEKIFWMDVWGRSKSLPIW